MERLGRFPARTGDARADAVAQLRWSMGGAGLTAEKLLRMPDVLALPTVRVALAGLPAEQVAQAAYDAVANGARQMGNGLRERLLRAGLAIDYAGDRTDLTGRRAEFEEVSGRTARSLYQYEQSMLEALVTRLGIPPAHAAPPRANLALGPWVFEERTLLYRMKGRAGRVAELTDVLRATEDGLDQYWLWYFCSSANAAAKVDLRWGGAIVDNREDGQPGVRRVTVSLPRALMAGETYEVRYDVRYPTRREGDTWCALRALRPTGAVTVRVAFEPAELPGRVWRLDGMPPMAGHGDPDECKPLAVDSLGFVETSFDRTEVPFGYGVGWEW